MAIKTTEGALLDTHVWVWLNEGSPEVKPKIVKIINKSAQEHRLYISAISIWEIGMLVNKKRLALQMPLDEWVMQALRAPGVELLPLLPSIAIDSTQLPGKFHGDPADRIIAASARIRRLTLITRDQQLLHYAKNGHLKALKA